ENKNRRTRRTEEKNRRTRGKNYSRTRQWDLGPPHGTRRPTGRQIDQQPGNQQPGTDMQPTAGHRHASGQQTRRKETRRPWTTAGTAARPGPLPATTTTRPVGPPTPGPRIGARVPRRARITPQIAAAPGTPPRRPATCDAERPPTVPIRRRSVQRGSPVQRGNAAVPSDPRPAAVEPPTLPGLTGALRPDRHAPGIRARPGHDVPRRVGVTGKVLWPEVRRHGGWTIGSPVPRLTPVGPSVVPRTGFEMTAVMAAIVRTGRAERTLTRPRSVLAPGRGGRDISRVGQAARSRANGQQAITAAVAIWKTGPAAPGPVGRRTVPAPGKAGRVSRKTGRAEPSPGAARTVARPEEDGRDSRTTGQAERGQT